KALFDEAAAECERILTEHADQLRALAEYLLVHETIEADEFRYFFEHGEFMPEEVKAGKQARYDKTIERPAKKISMTDGTEAEPAPEPAEESAAVSEPQEPAEASEPAAEASEPEKPAEEEQKPATEE
ncbi:MAG: hypothetical protein J6P58_03760, partial [Oscillospiraceae bacterium]|nr:hypothetical protein [Oscillospiraceae bacterium]